LNVTIVVAVLALIGVGLSQWNARVVVRKQLEHDSEQRDRERTMSLRREVYLEAGAAISLLTQALGRISHVKYDMDATAADFTNGLAKLAKVQIVGSEETVEAVMAYVNAVGAAFMQLVIARAPMTALQTMIDSETDPARKNQLTLEKTRKILAAGDRGIDLAVATIKLVPNALLAVRKEMNLPLDRVRYERLWNAQLQTMQESWQRAKTQLENMLPKT
jgi:hypothetical protein